MMFFTFAVFTKHIDYRSTIQQRLNLILSKLHIWAQGIY